MAPRNHYLDSLCTLTVMIPEMIKEKIVFVKIFETSLGSNILASFIEFQYQSTDTFGFIGVQIQGNF